MWVYFGLFTSLHHIHFFPPQTARLNFSSVPMLQLGSYLLTAYTYLQIDKTNNYVFGEIPVLLKHFCVILLCESEEFTTLCT
jgi:hypothetical protein